jgi:hypothetical protein
MGSQSNPATVIDYDDPRLQRAIDRWNLIEFLDSYNVNYATSGKNVGRNFIGVSPCPQCGDRRNHFGIHRDSKAGNCFSCGQKFHPIRIVSFFGRMTHQKAFDYLIALADVNVDVKDRVNEILHSKRKEKVGRELGMDALPESRPIGKRDLALIEPLKAFFQKRRLTLWHSERYDLRLSIERKGYIIFPCRIAGKVVSYQQRTLLGKKYYSADHLEQYLFNEDRIVNGQPLILVEGFLDMTRIDTYITLRYPGRIQVVTGGLKSLSAAQKSRLTKYQPNPLIVMFDNDSWFNFKYLKDAMPFEVDYVILPKGADPGSLTWSQMDELFTKEVDHHVQTQSNHHA